MNYPFSILEQVPGGIKKVAIMCRYSDPFSAGIAATTKAHFIAQGAEIVLDVAIPSTVAQSDPMVKAFAMNQFVNSSFPQDLDLFFLISSGSDMQYVASAMYDAERTPKMALFSQYYLSL